MADGLTCSLMVGIAENYLPAFALALGMGELTAGLIASVPILAGAIMQLASPLGLHWFGSHRRWVVACVLVQAASLVPLAVAAVAGSIPVAPLFILAAVYWGSGMASGPAWTSWVDTLVPERIRSRYFGSRARIVQAGTLIGFVFGGLWLQLGHWLRVSCGAFAVLFVIAAICRLVSAACLTSQREPVRPVSANIGGGNLRDIIGGLRNSGSGRLLIYLWAMQAAAQVAAPFFAPFMLGQLGFSYTRFMIVISISLLAKAVALPALGQLARRFGTMRLLWIGGLIVIPLPTFWMFSHATPYLLVIQLAAGTAWATYELAVFLLCFEVIEARMRIGWLTIYNLGYAAATVAGSLIGGALLAACGTGTAAYLAVFAASFAARVLTLPLLWRIDFTAVRQSSAVQPLRTPNSRYRSGTRHSPGRISPAFRTRGCGTRFINAWRFLNVVLRFHHGICSAFDSIQPNLRPRVAA